MKNIFPSVYELNVSLRLFKSEKLEYLTDPARKDDIHIWKKLRKRKLNRSILKGKKSLQILTCSVFFSLFFAEFHQEEFVVQ